MNFQQLRIIRETVRQNFNLTTVADTLFTSQPGVSRHIKDLEEELGVEIFIRRGKRILGLTQPGQELLVIVERMLLDTANLKHLASHYSEQDIGQLTVVTTHTQARYSLPPIVNAFRTRYPRVHLRLHQGSPLEIRQMLLDGEADIGIATEALADEEELIHHSFYNWQHCVIVSKNHPLANHSPVYLAEVAEFPIITYQAGFTGRQKIDDVFANAGLLPDIAISALDADVIKTYVEMGLGVGIIASMAFLPDKDHNLVKLQTHEAFPTNTTSIAVRKGHYLRGFAQAFIDMARTTTAE